MADRMGQGAGWWSALEREGLVDYLAVAVDDLVPLEPLRRGDYQGWESALLAQGTPVEVFSERRAASRRSLLPRLFAAYQDTRLMAAVAAMEELHDRALALLAQSHEQHFRGLLLASPDPTVIVGSDGRITLVNQQMEKLFGYTQEELVGQPVELLVPRRFAAAHPGHRAGYAEGPVPRPMGAGIELFGRKKDGSEFPCDISLSPLSSGEGPLVTAAIRDLSDRRRTEAALQLAIHELESFSYSVAHDLRAPLRGMRGFAQLLLEVWGERLDVEARDWLWEILGNAKRMGNLIDALLSLARVTRSELRPESLSLSPLANHSIAHLRAAAPDRSVEVVIAEGLRAEVDPALARVLVDNLVGNAWKFTGNHAAPRIELGQVVKQGEPAFFVRDNGAGFDMAYAQKLFAPFQRLHGTAEFPGTGIGLATVERIVHRHGGRIWAEGVVGQGASFYFTLPGVKP